MKHFIAGILSFAFVCMPFADKLYDRAAISVSAAASENGSGNEIGENTEAAIPAGSDDLTLLETATMQNDIMRGEAAFRYTPYAFDWKDNTSAALESTSYSPISVHFYDAKSIYYRGETLGAPPVDATGYVYEDDVCVGQFDTFGRPANIANDGGYDPDKLGTYNVTYYSFQYKSMTVSVVEREKGDINSDGKCTIADAILLSRYTAEDEVNTARYAEPNGYRAFANLQNVFDYADYNGDGFINLLDVAQQIAIIAKLD